MTTTTATIRVMAILPEYAHNDLDDARDGAGELAYSAHVATWRGLANAIRTARELHADYTQTHGNGAAHRVRIDGLGVRAHANWWESLANTMCRHPLTEETVARFRRIQEDAEREMAARERAEEEREAAAIARAEGGTR